MTYARSNRKTGNNSRRYAIMLHIVMSEVGKTRVFSYSSLITFYTAYQACTRIQKGAYIYGSYLQKWATI